METIKSVNSPSLTAYNNENSNIISNHSINQNSNSVVAEKYEVNSENELNNIKNEMDFWNTVGATTASIGTIAVGTILNIGETAGKMLALVGSAVLSVPFFVIDSINSVIGNESSYVNETWGSFNEFRRNQYTNSRITTYLESEGGQWMTDNSLISSSIIEWLFTPIGPYV